MASLCKDIAGKGKKATDTEVRDHLAGTSGTYREFSVAGRCADCWRWWDMRLVGNRNQTTEGLLRWLGGLMFKGSGSHRRDLIIQQVWTSTHKFKHAKIWLLLYSSTSFWFWALPFYNINHNHFWGEGSLKGSTIWSHFWGFTLYQGIWGSPLVFKQPVHRLTNHVDVEVSHSIFSIEWPPWSGSHQWPH